RPIRYRSCSRNKGTEGLNFNPSVPFLSCAASGVGGRGRPVGVVAVGFHGTPAHVPGDPGNVGGLDSNVAQGVVAEGTQVEGGGTAHPLQGLALAGGEVAPPGAGGGLLDRLSQGVDGVVSQHF